MKKVVIIDDNELILHLISKSLEGDYETCTFSSSIEGYEFVRSNPVDLVILDLQMPHMDGLELCSKLKSNPETKAIPVLIVSAKSGSNSRSLAYRIGAINYLEKPFEVEELRNLVKSIISQTSHSKEIDVLQYEDLTLNTKTHFCSHDNDEFNLTISESIILELLINSAESPITREQLINALPTEKVTSRTIDTHISKIRKKIKYSNVQIVSIYGLGYQLMPIRKVA